MRELRRLNARVPVSRRGVAPRRFSKGCPLEYGCCGAG